MEGGCHVRCGLCVAGMARGGAPGRFEGRRLLRGSTAGAAPARAARSRYVARCCSRRSCCPWHAGDPFSSTNLVVGCCAVCFHPAPCFDLVVYFFFFVLWLLLRLALVVVAVPSPAHKPSLARHFLPPAQQTTAATLSLSRSPSRSSTRATRRPTRTLRPRRSPTAARRSGRCGRPRRTLRRRG